MTRYMTVLSLTLVLSVSLTPAQDRRPQRSVGGTRPPADNERGLRELTDEEIPPNLNFYAMDPLYDPNAVLGWAEQRIEETLAGFGDVQFDYVHLKDVELKPCRGCFMCFMNGNERCPVKDDKEMIAQRLEEADGVIFVSPVYSMHVSSLMKLFVDRRGGLFGTGLFR